MKKFFLIPVVAIAATFLSSCNKNSPEGEASTDYSDAGMWCSRPEECKSATDAFYVVSTMIEKSTNPDGSESFTARLTEEEKAVLASEINHVHNDIIPEDVNFFAPYYHEITLSAGKQLTPEQLVELFGKTKKEVCDAFDYYMAHHNDGRPFMLVGYSQGAVMVRTLVQHMTDGQYGRMVAAYIMGLGLNDEDLGKPHMKAAAGKDDTGCIISWNSVKTVKDIFEPIWSNASTCMNPVSWSPDDTAKVKYTFDGEELTLQVDTAFHVLTVAGLHPENHPGLPKWETPWGENNYHDYETYLYNPYVRENMSDRIAAFGK